MAQPTEVDVSKIPYYNADGTPQNGTGTTNSGSGGGWLTGILGALPGVLTALFPSGVNGNGSNNYPTVTTNPAGVTTIGMQGSSNNFLIIAMLGIIIVFLFTGKGIQPKKAK